MCGARDQAIKATLIGCKQGQDFLYNACYFNMIQAAEILSTMDSGRLVQPIATGRGSVACLPPR